MKKIKLITFVLLFLTLILAEGGSVYSRYGIGLSKFHFAGRELGLGGNAIAMNNNYYLNIENPSLLSTLSTTKFYTGYSIEGRKIEDDKFSKNYFNGSLDGFAFGFPVSQEMGIGVMFGLKPVTKVNYEIVNKASGAAASTEYSGEGGLSNLFLALSVSPYNGNALGFQFNYYYGKTTYTSDIYYESGDFRDTYFARSHNYYGIGLKASFLSQDLAGFLGFEKISDLRFALIYDFNSKINTDTTVSSGAYGGQLFEQSGITKTELPSKFQAGISFLINKSTFFYFDYVSQNYTELKTGDNLYTNMDNMYRLSLGFETNNQQSYSTSFFEEFNFRGGLLYEKMGLKIRGNELKKLGISAGFSMPIGFDSTLDFGIEAGKFGTTDNGLLKETYINASVGINIGELWFIRPER